MCLITHMDENSRVTFEIHSKNATINIVSIDSLAACEQALYLLAGTNISIGHCSCKT